MYLLERDLLILLQLMGDYFKDLLGSKRDQSFQLLRREATQRIVLTVVLESQEQPS